MKGLQAVRPVWRADAAFSTERRTNMRSLLPHSRHFFAARREIFHTETSPNISKFLVIIFACNLHRDV
ncbi:hypothetical protein [Burkholderia vietnamiensis]|uniref:hypothetical protein n=1 Tax=Burkholderia vietnamiensis TaxID=60552 RepID=UPI0012D9BA73|nr:hypothetical protein [Burkholderia vietnamiensis]